MIGPASRGVGFLAALSTVTVRPEKDSDLTSRSSAVVISTTIRCGSAGSEEPSKTSS